MMVQPISFLDKACHQQESKTQCIPPNFQGNCGRLCPLHVSSWHPPERGEARLHLLHRLLIPSGDYRQRQAWSKSVLQQELCDKSPSNCISKRTYFPHSSLWQPKWQLPLGRSIQIVVERGSFTQCCGGSCENGLAASLNISSLLLRSTFKPKN